MGWHPLPAKAALAYLPGHSRAWHRDADEWMLTTRVWRLMPVILAFGRPRREGCWEFQGSLGYRVKHFQKQKSVSLFYLIYTFPKEFGLLCVLPVWSGQGGPKREPYPLELEL